MASTAIPTSVPSIEERFNQEMFSREARAESFACLLWLSVIILTYALFLIGGEMNSALGRNISLLVLITVPLFILIYMLIRGGQYRPVLAYLNTLLQLSVVSGAIYFDTQAYGTQYALSSMPPIAYGLVIIVTAFRLRPLMGIFAGAIAAAQFLTIYVFVSRDAPDMTAELLVEVPSLDWEVTIMKVVILLGLGAAGSFSAYSLRNELYNFIATAREELRLHQSLGRYVSQEVADALRQDDTFALKPRSAEVTVMFGDIRNFTRFANSSSPEEVAALVNNFFDNADSAISKHHGVLNKFLGDGFMAIFGLFDHEDDPRELATRAGFDILATTNERLSANKMGVGIALNHGDVIAGEIGSEGRCEFTVLGNTVNIAARLEGLNRKLHTDFLVTRDFYDMLPADLVNIRTLELHEIRGIKEPVELIELQSLKS